MRKKMRRIADAIGFGPPGPAVEVIDMPTTECCDPLHPPLALLAKLGFIAVRACALLREKDPMFERLALDRLLNDTEVRDWMNQMAEAAYIPRRED